MDFRCSRESAEIDAPVVFFIGSRCNRRSDCLLRRAGTAPDNTHFSARFTKSNVQHAKRKHLTKEVAVASRSGDADDSAILLHSVCEDAAKYVPRHFHVQV